MLQIFLRLSTSYSINQPMSIQHMGIGPNGNQSKRLLIHLMGGYIWRPFFKKGYKESEKKRRPDEGRPVKRRRYMMIKESVMVPIPCILCGFPKMPLFVRVTSLFFILKMTGKDARTPEKPW
jgi:hypothetical protein